MKKILALMLVCLMTFSLAACGPKEEDVTPGDIEIIEPADREETTPSDESKPSDDNLPDNNNETDKPNNVTPDGDYTVDLNEQKTVYEENGIKITFKNTEEQVGFYDKHSFSVENNSGKNIAIWVSTAVINGRNVGCLADDFIAPSGETKELLISTSVTDRQVVAKTIDDINCMEYDISIVEVTDIESFTCGSILEENIVLSLTNGQHNHRNDKVTVNGDKVFENDEIILYINSTPTRDDFSDNYAYTVVNKTDKLIKFDMSKAEYKVSTFDNPEFTMVIGGLNYIAPHSYCVGDFMLYNTKYDELTEVKLTLAGEYSSIAHNMLEKSGAVLDYNEEIVTINTKR